MEALEVLQNRISMGILRAPGPTETQLQHLKRAAVRAADHRLLRPWRFLVVEGEGLDRLGELFVRALEAEKGALSEEQKAKAAAKPHRAPMIVIAIANCREDEKVPEVEQILSTGAAVQNILNAAYAQGLGAMWRTGDFAYNDIVKEGLGLAAGDSAAGESIVGFIYLGTPPAGSKTLPEINLDEHFTNWP